MSDALYLNAVGAAHLTPRARPAASPRSKKPPAASPRAGFKAETGFTKSSLVQAGAGARSDFASSNIVRGESYGLLSDPTVRGGGADRSRREVPAELVFFSWWNEEVPLPPEFVSSGMGMGVRRQMELRFRTRDNVFQLLTDDARVPIAFRVEHADGSPLQATELHVGARIDVLGRPTTLQRANARTIAWIDVEAKRLLRYREALCDELSKFCDVSKLLAKKGIHRLYLAPRDRPEEKARRRPPKMHTVWGVPRLTHAHPDPRQVEPKLGGETNLSRLHTEVAVLEAQLNQHRG